MVRKRKTVLVFTGGGLAPALNATLYGVVTEARKHDWRVLGGMFGWACLDLGGRVVDLTRMDIEPLKSVGGTVLRSSRTDPAAIPGGISTLKQRLRTFGVDYLVPIGGNDTLGAAAKLAQAGIPIVGVPKTVDNDIPGTHWSPGFPSAAYYMARYCKEIRQDAAYALSRVYVVEIQGQSAGWLVASASLGGADVILPPEQELDPALVLGLIEKRYRGNGAFATVAVAQYANLGPRVTGTPDDQRDGYGANRREFIGLALRREIKRALGIDAKFVAPGNYAQTGPPVAIDRKLATILGRHAISLLARGHVGYMASIAHREGRFVVTHIPLSDVNWSELKVLDSYYFDFQNLTVTSKYTTYLTSILGSFRDATDTAYTSLVRTLNKKRSP